MKKQLILIVSSLIIMVNGAFSQTVPINKAQKVAKNFYYERAYNHDNNVKYNNVQIDAIKTEIAGNDSVYYIFKVNANKGWIIVSAQQNVIPVLAYSLEGEFDTVKANQPPAFKYWLNNYKSQIQYAISHNITADTFATAKWTYYNSYNATKGSPKQINSISPLLQTTWKQCGYYNDLCPIDANSVCGDSPNRVPVGCVATAMAQVMKYWNYPESGSGSHINAYRNYGTLAGLFSATTYNFANMPNNVTSSNSDVATLMYHCGIAVDMNYGPTGSGAYTRDAKNALLWYFRYDLTAYYRNKDDDGYTDAAWNNLIINDLNNNFPVIMGGQDASLEEGHEYVCDGYDSPNYFHFNWGWGWPSGGNYCYVSAIIPTGSGYNFSSGQDAIFNLAPPCGQTLNSPDVTGSFEDRCTIYLESGFNTSAGGTFHAKIVP
jgi:hypothetical protein